MEANQQIPSTDTIISHGNILAQLSSNSMVTFVMEDYTLAVLPSPDNHFGVISLVNYSNPGNANNFQLVDYSWDGNLLAKASIASLDNPGWYWNSKSDADGLTNAFVLGQNPETIILEAVPANTMLINFATSYAPPPSQTRINSIGNIHYLSFGYSVSVMAAFNVLVTG